MSPDIAARYTCETLTELKCNLEKMTQDVDEETEIEYYKGGIPPAITTLKRYLASLKRTEDTKLAREAIERALWILQDIDLEDEDVFNAIDEAKEDACILAQVYGGQQPHRI